MIPLIVLLAAVGMIVIERLVPGRRWSRVRGWWARALLLNGAQAGLVFVAGITWEPWLRAHRPWSADRLGTVGGALVGYLVITFVYYWWHRCRHAVPVLWRWLHQLHHSPQRIEVITSFYKHPLELIANSILSAAILFMLVGCGAEAASTAVLMTGLAELFYHWNVATPRWLGWFVQRPEMHCVHHQQGVHHFNFADLPLWDLCFGTYRNPPVFTDQCGFGDAEHRLGALLAGCRVDTVATEAAS